MPVRYYKYLIAIIGIVIFLTFNITNIKDIFSLDYIQKNLYNLNLFYEKYSFLFILIFLFVYIIFTALSIPVATILSLLAGFMLWAAGVLCCAGGIGGGVIYVTVLMVFGALSVHDAIPLSKVVVFAASTPAMYHTCRANALGSRVRLSRCVGRSP